MIRKIHWSPAAAIASCAVLALTGCSVIAPPAPSPATPPVIPAAPPSVPAPAPAPAPAVPRAPGVGAGATFERATWQDLPGWREDDLASAWPALLETCAALKLTQEWQSVCELASGMHNPGDPVVRQFFEGHFAPYRVADARGSDQGLITGYYEPLLHGSRKPSSRYRYPVYGVPDDLLVVALDKVHPELKGLQLRGRVEGRRVVPYFDRAQIEAGKGALSGKEIVWIDDPVELFFLQVQGSGRVQLDDGQMMRIGFAEQNGRPYTSVGRWLVERGELPLEKASMQGIREWARRNPGKLANALHQNARYVFFRELPADLSGPIGALGVPLTARRSIAIDPQFVPLGAPAFIATTWPGSQRPLNRLVLAQDSGGAIRGAVRADFFWGFGEEAAREAGRMKQALRMWVLLPNGFPVPPSLP